MDAVCIKDLKKELKKEIDDSRYEHTLGVMYTCAALAMRYNYDFEKAMLAGLLHDCAKCMDNDKRISICKKHHISITEVEKRNPFLLHAKVGSFIAMDKYHIHDTDIINAIVYGLAAEIIHHIIGVMAVAQQVLPPQKHLQFCMLKALPQSAQTHPGILFEKPQCRIKSSTSPAFHCMVSHPVHLLHNRKHLVCAHSGRDQGLVRITQDSLHNLNRLFLYCHFIFLLISLN